MAGVVYNKASGLHNISAKLLKHGHDVIATELSYVFSLMYKNKDVSDEWMHGIIVTLPKKVSPVTVGQH